MHAYIGDRLVIESLRPDVPTRISVIVGVSRPGGHPPYQVRWTSGGHVTLIIPGPDARLEPLPRAGDKVTQP
ncbi:hypothetical protein ACTI_67140 [Actinoplanes sp. OR16]|uniref:DUF1918 domain-containing protein n=1 Tax=Actinoplanes sp. OR16 TaxID=946334 RepID=UPI000F713833|nr:DUF1918 domain-containing protein [Actinoplanes sp. OR16]BBH70029.1 hypothetical protein ACTI_67140 [Actinoplanes sp. OR16]